MARELGVSRQYIWQMGKKAEGRCRNCGKKPLLTADFCKGCRNKVNARRNLLNTRARKESR